MKAKKATSNDAEASFRRRSLRRASLLLCAISLGIGVAAGAPNAAPQSGIATASEPRSDIPNVANSVEGLQQQLRYALAVARSGDEKKLAAVVQEMEIPDYEAWFSATFGPAGPAYAKHYGTELAKRNIARQNMLRATAHNMNASHTEKVLVRKVNDAPEAGNAFESGVVKNLQRRVDIYFAYYATRAPKPNPIGYFVFVDGKFRWQSGFVAEVVTTRLRPAQ
jgi:hypothetical protein